jgi:hypothetical protein
MEDILDETIGGELRDFQTRVVFTIPNRNCIDEIWLEVQLPKNTYIDPDIKYPILEIIDSIKIIYQGQMITYIPKDKLKLFMRTVVNNELVYSRNVNSLRVRLPVLGSNLITCSPYSIRTYQLIGCFQLEVGVTAKSESNILTHGKILFRLININGFNKSLESGNLNRYFFDSSLVKKEGCKILKYFPPQTNTIYVIGNLSSLRFEREGLDIFTMKFVPGDHSKHGVLDIRYNDRIWVSSERYGTRIKLESSDTIDPNFTIYMTSEQNEEIFFIGVANIGFELQSHFNLIKDN